MVLLYITLTEALKDFSDVNKEFDLGGWIEKRKIIFPK